jgi:hypothetical protein
LLQVNRGAVEKGESSQEKCEIKAKKSEWSAGVQGVQVQGESQGGQGDKTTLPSTVPAPRWCPPVLSKTQCWWVQKLRAREIEKRRREAEHDIWFNKEHPMITSKKTWKEKRIEKEDRDSDSGCEGDAAASEPGMEVDINMVFQIPAEFALPVAEAV